MIASVLSNSYNVILGPARLLSILLQERSRKYPHFIKKFRLSYNIDFCVIFQSLQLLLIR